MKNEAVCNAAALVKQVYKGSPVGGNLHAQLDDWNLDDISFNEFTQYHDLPADHIAIERECFSAFKALSPDERGAALALAQGYLD